MAFTLTRHSYWWPVEVQLPDPDRAGRFIRQGFRVKFTTLFRELADLTQALMREETDPINPEQLATDLIRQIVIDWADVVDATGNAVAFTPERFATASYLPWFRRAVFDAFLQSLSGQERPHIH